MDNMDIYEKNKVTTQSLNQKIDEMNMKEIFAGQVRTAVDMQRIKQGYDAQFYSVSQTEKDRIRIAKLLDAINAGDFKVSEKEKAKLEAINGRNMSHLMLNAHKFTGDSEEMTRVKDALSAIELQMMHERKSFTSNNAEYLIDLYHKAMDECQKYINAKHPKRETGKKRKQMVQATLKRLMIEVDGIELGRRILVEKGSEAKEVKKGMDLLTLAAAQKLADQMEDKKVVDKKAELTAEHELRKSTYDLSKNEYDTLLAEKTKDLSFAAKWSFEADKDEELKALKKRLNLSVQKAELDRVDNEIKKLTTKQEEKTAAEANKKTEAEAVFKENLKDADKRINNLPPDLKPLIKLVNEGAVPTSLIADKNKLKPAEMKKLSEMLRIFDVLKGFKTGSEEAKTIRVGGEFVCFSQDRFGNFSLKYKEQSISFVNTASEARDIIASDVISNWKIYGDEAVRNIIEDTKTDLSKMSRGDLQNTREYAVTVLFQLSGIPKTLLNNFTCGELKELALEALKLKDDNKKFKLFKQKLKKQAEKNNTEKKEDQINTVVNLELQRVGFKQAEGVILNIEKQQDKSLWDENERKVRDLAADLIFSKDTWVADGLAKKPEERIRHVLLENADAVALIVADQFRDMKAQPDGIIEKMIDKLPLAEMGAEQLSELKNSVKDALGKVRDLVNEKVEEELERKNLKGMKNVVKAGILTKFGLLPHIKKVLENLDKEQLEKMKGIDSAIDEAVEQNMQEVQNTFDDCVDEVFSKDNAGAVYEQELIDGLTQLEDEQYNKLVEKENKFEAARKKRLDNKRKGAAAAEGNNNENEENEENLKLNRFERTRKKRLENKRKEALADKADREALEIKRRNAHAIQKPIAEIHSEIDKTIKIVDELKKQSAKEKNGQKEQTLRLIEQHNKEIKGMQELADQLSKQFDEVTQAVNTYSKRINIREINMRMYKRKEGEAVLREAIMEEECDIEKAQEKIKEIEKDKNEAIQSANDNGRKLRDEDIAPYDNDITDEQIRIGACRERIKTAKQSLKDFENALPKDSARELDKVIENAAKGGEKGQSLFMKNVLKTYFKNVSVLDKRSMLASAIRNSDPMPPMTEEEKENLSKDQKLSAMSGFLGGMFKGAGPLFQKMLQGLPKSSLPEGLKKAVEDTQDSLASIPDEVVMAHMDAIKKRSNKQISKIDIKKSLGAASVGQAFLCTIYGPKMKEGKDVVIKLLRPDVRNRMMREKDVMLEAARMTDAEGKTKSEVDEMRRKGQKGGMEATYLGNLQRIEEELDLTIEAKNCKEGQIYDKALEGKENLCDSMKLSDIVEPTTDTCMMEIAGKQTVKSYMNGIEEKMQQLLWDFCVKENEKDKNGNDTGKQILKKNKDGSFDLRQTFKPDELEKLEQVRQELGKLLEDAELRTRALAQLAEKWVTQGVFEKGYYHGDLHAGNIMISEKGVTVIDFGNATTLTSDQQKHITKMMIAATMGDVEKFRHGFHQLLENTPEEVYQEKREELTLVFKEIMSMGDEKKPAERIAAALIRAQELGLELPPTIANFSSCQMRLQNTVSDMNNTLLALRNNVKQLGGELACTDKYIQKDPVAKFKADNRTKSASNKKEAAGRWLSERECPSKDYFLELVRDKNRRYFVMQQYGFNNVVGKNKIDKELAWIDQLLKGEKKLSQVILDRMDRNGADDIFKTIGDVKDSNENNKKVYDLAKTLLDTLEVILGDLPTYDEDVREAFCSANEYLKNGVPKSVEELIKRIKTVKPELKDAELKVESREVDLKLRAYYDACDEGKLSKEELEPMENELYEEYMRSLGAEKQQEVENKKKEWKEDLLKFIPTINKDDKRDAQHQLLNNRTNQLDLIEKMIQSCEDNGGNGEELKKEGAELTKLWRETTKDEESLNKNVEALKNKYDHVLDLLWDGQIQKFKEIQKDISENTGNKVKIEVSDEEPDSFLSIMGGVLKSKRKQMLFRLDLTTTIRVLWQMYKEKGD